MDPRFDNDAQTTGTLPGIGAGATSLSGGASRPDPPAWLEEARAGLDPARAGRYLAFEQDGRVVVCPVTREWTRIGRSLAADIRFDDATVSRRHALVANEEAGVRVLDDRSLNGIQVNGRRVEWSPLTDGDELAVGRHSLYFLDTVSTPAPTSPVALTE
jgi:pSer/pThr/pTyr-binding forkhead associated (FHA) protein